MINQYALKKIIQGVMILSFSLIFLDSFKSAIANENPSNLSQNQEENQKKNPLIGTEWQLMDWTENQALTKENSTIAFQKDALSGSGSCNRYTAGYGVQENAMKVGLIAATRKACTEEIMNQEMLFLGALEGAKIYSINAQGQLQIAYIKQKEIGILKFKK
ncbi:META domain-containing protein [Cyanothece sp. BG0011]|uniref:META domain-containing protein n=1 Tax=Cyanothece sp. BG0011 TaxID=2082950 RepID=UPI001E60D5B1|nr:META domain-containing protein [Cyanothece sp. BG0011]